MVTHDRKLGAIVIAGGSGFLGTSLAHHLAAAGRSFLVKYPDFLSRSPSGRTIIVHQDDDRYSMLNLLLVTELEFHAATKQQDEAAA